eukprot:CAMPEP_0118978344 /NCGR_PEP_ID=MMETSP1173-20130426/23419_1 /TAXON_ID=1034831 /ORGANISM="Rhizochromulina marina cf, Strain CCMP1243" /LENGTH=336 /DNA_ID=CAMNT_0006928529 /DNA_START=302 /DNA_END=1312 /DNA_ORIENTATION=-
MFTWGVTALGSALVFVLPAEASSRQKTVLDSMLGFAAGVMTAASFWSLLAPALEIAREQLGSSQAAVLPVLLGFALGGGAMHGADVLLARLGAHADTVDLVKAAASKKRDGGAPPPTEGGPQALDSPAASSSIRDGLSRRRSGTDMRGMVKTPVASPGSLKRTFSDVERGSLTPRTSVASSEKNERWRRVLLLVLAITIHNFPEGLAVGVGFGSAGSNEKAMVGAKSLAIGIALQNFPEGLAVSMPLRREGMSFWQSFFWGQLSGMVEPLGGVLGAYAVLLAKPILPYALAFAAGAMVFVVVDQLIPEAHQGSQRISTGGFMAGFAVMMVMDVALG